jgi:trans-aconitate 2-methyltransferase
LLERLPRGRVVALDASESMLDVARRELARFGDRVRFVHAVLAKDPLPAGMDVVFSNATFHWVHDHDALFRSIAASLVPGGRLHAQCGGEGNLDRAHARVMELAMNDPYRAHLEGMREPWVFAGVDETVGRLEAAGLSDVQVWLHPEPTPFPDASAYAEFVGAVVLRPFLALLPSALHERFIADVTARAEADDPPLELDYVRLEIRARRP